MQGNRGGRVCGGADTSSRNAAVSDRRAPPFENLTSLRPSRQRFDTFRVAGLGKILSVCRGWRRQPPISPWPARAPVGGARDRRGARGGGPAGWVLVGRRSAVRAPKVYKTLRLSSFGKNMRSPGFEPSREIHFGIKHYCGP